MYKNCNKITCFKIAALAAGMVLSGLSSAALVNGDFSAGFNGWQGGVADVPPLTIPPTPPTYTPISSLPGSFTNNYAISGGGALLTTTSTDTPPNDIWKVDLFQEFLIDALGGFGNTLQLSLNLSSALTDSGVDASFSQLEDLSGSPLAPLNLAGGGVFDITAWAGRNAKISFSVEDGDDGTDTLSVKNIGISQTQASVPEPSTLLLLSAGLVALRRKVF